MYNLLTYKSLGTSPFFTIFSYNVVTLRAIGLVTNKAIEILDIELKDLYIVL